MIRLLLNTKLVVFYHAEILYTFRSMHLFKKNKNESYLTEENI